MEQSGGPGKLYSCFQHHYGLLGSIHIVQSHNIPVLFIQHEMVSKTINNSVETGYGKALLIKTPSCLLVTSASLVFEK